MGVSKRGNVWYVKWRRSDGRWQRRATSATKRTDAMLMYAELVRQAERQKAGLEAMPVQQGHTFATLSQWWLKHHVSARTRPTTAAMVNVHITKTTLGALSPRAVTSAELDEYFSGLLERGFKASTVAKMRVQFATIFECARRAKLWAGENPARASRRPQVFRSPRPTFTPDEVETIIVNVPHDWRAFFATAAYLGLRKGELCGLRKTDYDATRRTLTVGHSYANEGTKGKRVDVLPVTDALGRHLDEAMKSPGAMLFPGPKGFMRTQASHPQHVLRVALKRAGLVDGWLHSCRRCLARSRRRRDVQPVTELTSDEQPRRCPQCNALLWCTPQVRVCKFHDLRHTCATLLLKAGVPVQHVQRILRHANITTTVGTYGHLLTEDLRGAVGKLGPQPVQPPKLVQSA